MSWGIDTVCYVIAFVLFVAAALNWRPANALAAGLAFLTLGHVLGGVTLK